MCHTYKIPCYLVKVCLYDCISMFSKSWIGMGEYMKTSEHQGIVLTKCGATLSWQQPWIRTKLETHGNKLQRCTNNMAQISGMRVVSMYPWTRVDSIWQKDELPVVGHVHDWASYWPSTCVLHASSVSVLAKHHTVRAMWTRTGLLPKVDVSDFHYQLLFNCVHLIECCLTTIITSSVWTIAAKPRKSRVTDNLKLLQALIKSASKQASNANSTLWCCYSQWGCQSKIDWNVFRRLDPGYMYPIYRCIIKYSQGDPTVSWVWCYSLVVAAGAHCSGGCLGCAERRGYSTSRRQQTTDKRLEQAWRKFDLGARTACQHPAFRPDCERQAEQWPAQRTA